MSEDRFWHIIDAARETGDILGNLGASLQALEPHEIVEFENILNRLIADAATFPVLAACFVIMSYVSDDTFLDFRAWLVTQGRDRYTAAINDPETIANWLSKDEANDIDGESMLTLASRAYQVRGSEGDFFDQVVFVPDPDIKEDWPENKREYRQRFPRLVDKFWTQERINELHPD